jgi:hypothetical protein
VAHGAIHESRLNKGTRRAHNKLSNVILKVRKKERKTKRKREERGIVPKRV